MIRGRSGALASAAALTLAVALSLAGCSGAEQHGSVGSRVSSWVKGVGLKSSVSTLRGDDTRIDRVVAANDPAAIRTDCAVLLSDDQQANENLPSPDDDLTSLLTDAYEAEQNAANDCYDGANGGRRGTELQKSAIERTAAQMDLTSAVLLVQQLSGKKIG